LGSVHKRHDYSLLRLSSSLYPVPKLLFFFPAAAQGLHGCTERDDYIN
jgi:hypothetical protein